MTTVDDTATADDGGMQRIEIDFTAVAYATFQEVMKKDGTEVHAVAARHALAMLDWYLKRLAEGWVLQTAKDDQVEEIELGFGKEEKPEEEVLLEKRVTMDLSPEAYTRVEAMMAKTDSPTPAPIFRNAIRLYHWYLNKRDDGWELRIAKDGKAKVVETQF